MAVRAETRERSELREVRAGKKLWIRMPRRLRDCLNDGKGGREKMCEVVGLDWFTERLGEWCVGEAGWTVGS